MAGEASVRVNLRAAEFEISGSEQFVEKMMQTLGDLVSSAPELATEEEQQEQVIDRGKGGDAHDLGSFLASKKLTKQSPTHDKIVSFVYFHTKIKKHGSAQSADLMTMFEDAGFPKPSNLPRDLKNLTRTDGKAYLLSAGYGKYKLTIGGENYVLELGSK